VPQIVAPPTGQTARFTAAASPLKMLKDLPGLHEKEIFARGMAEPGAANNAPVQYVNLNNATTYTFKAFNADYSIVNIQATKKAAGSKCLIFVENGIADTPEFSWQEQANLFDTVVWPKNTGIFGEPVIVDQETGKIIILYFKMRYNNQKEEPGILGYFWQIDLQTTNLTDQQIKWGYYSNKMNIFYMNYAYIQFILDNKDRLKIPDDLPQGMPLTEYYLLEMERTLFHEFQHMINFCVRNLAGKTGMDLWMNEGLAESAEHYGLGTVGASRINSMNDDSKGRLSNGWSLVAWTDADDINYGLVYTFMQYLRIQCNDWHFMKDLINNASGTFAALESVMSARGKTDLNTFPKMLQGYHLARFINDTTGNGLYSFKNEKSDFTFITRAPSVAVDSSLKIGPGGAVFIPVDSANLTSYSPSGAGKNIKYAKTSGGVLLSN